MFIFRQRRLPLVILILITVLLIVVGLVQATFAPGTGLGQASALDAKSSALAYLAVLAALRLESGIPFHVKAAKAVGTSREEIVSAILIGLPAAGHVVTQALPAAITSFDQPG